MTNPTAAALMNAGLSKSMAYHAVTGHRKIGVPLALWLLDNDGLKVGPLTGMSARQIETLKAVYQPSAPKSVIERRSARAA